jgi:hypothetical protein
MAATKKKSLKQHTNKLAVALFGSAGRSFTAR